MLNYIHIAANLINYIAEKKTKYNDDFIVFAALRRLFLSCSVSLISIPVPFSFNYFCVSVRFN